MLDFFKESFMLALKIDVGEIMIWLILAPIFFIVCVIFAIIYETFFNK